MLVQKDPTHLLISYLTQPLLSNVFLNTTIFFILIYIIRWRSRNRSSPRHKIFSKQTQNPENAVSLFLISLSIHRWLVNLHFYLSFILSPFWQSKFSHQCGDWTWVPDYSSLVYCCLEQLQTMAEVLQPYETETLILAFVHVTAKYILLREARSKLFLSSMLLSLDASITATEKVKRWQVLFSTIHFRFLSIILSFYH